MNFEPDQPEDIYVCELCECSSTELEVIKIHMLEHGAESAVVSQQESILEPPETLEQATELGNPVVIKWSNKMTLQLISLVEEFDNKFQSSVKQFVWKKIASIINKSHGTNLTPVQVDTKWKGLKRTYQDIKKHNSKSGNNIKKWQFFDAMHSFLFKKPEINPVATCSNYAGLVKKQELGQDKNELSSETLSSDELSHQLKLKETPKRTREDNFVEFTSLFSTKRRANSSVNVRHKEKMERNDRFLNIFERFVKAVEKQSNKGETENK